MATTIATQTVADVEGRRVPGELPLEPLQRPHRRRVFTTEQERQERDEQAHSQTLEHHHEQGAAEHRGQPGPLGAEERAQPADHKRKFAEMFQGAQWVESGYGICRVERAADDVGVQLDSGAWPLTRDPRAELGDRRVPLGRR